MAGYDAFGDDVFGQGVFDMVSMEQLRGASFALRDGSGGHAVPEPAVRSWLHELVDQRIPIPAAVALPAGDAGSRLAHAAWEQLREPLVLKAFGPGLVHKSDAAAVRVGLRADEVSDAIASMGHALAAGGMLRHGYLIEEQQPPGLELAVRASRSGSQGPVVRLALAQRDETGTDSSVTRLCPISREEAGHMVDELPGAALLMAAQPIDRAALIELLLAVAGSGSSLGPSVVEVLGDALLEFECNPVVATLSGVCAVDTRLILGPPQTSFGAS